MKISRFTVHYVAEEVVQDLSMLSIIKTALKLYLVKIFITIQVEKRLNYANYDSALIC